MFCDTYVFCDLRSRILLTSVRDIWKLRSAGRAKHSKSRVSRMTHEGESTITREAYPCRTWVDGRDTQEIFDFIDLNDSRVDDVPMSSLNPLTHDVEDQMNPCVLYQNQWRHQVLLPTVNRLYHYCYFSQEIDSSRRKNPSLCRRSREEICVRLLDPSRADNPIEYIQVLLLISMKSRNAQTSSVTFWTMREIE